MITAAVRTILAAAPAVAGDRRPVTALVRSADGAAHDDALQRVAEGDRCRARSFAEYWVQRPVRTDDAEA